MKTIIIDSGFNYTGDRVPIVKRFHVKSGSGGKDRVSVAEGAMAEYGEWQKEGGERRVARGERRTVGAGASLPAERRQKHVCPARWTAPRLLPES